MKGPGARVLNNESKRKASRSPLRADKEGKSPLQRGESSSASRSQSPLGTYRKNLERRYGAKVVTQDSFKSHGGVHPINGSRGHAGGFTGAPRSQSNLQKLEFKANQEDDAPQLAGEESDFSDDQKHKGKGSPSQARSSKIRKQASGKPFEEPTEDVHPKELRSPRPVTK